MSSQAKETVLETRKVREAVGIVRDRGTLEKLVDALLLEGVDRADIDLLAPRKTVIKHLDKFYRTPEEVIDEPDAPRTELVLDDDTTTIKALAFGTLTGIGTLGAAGLLVASGGALPAVLLAAGAGGAAGSALGKLIADRLGASALEQFESDFRLGGLAVFVRLREGMDEEKIRQTMARAGALNIRVHEIEIAKKTDDLPLADIRPDPLLSQQRLGEIGGEPSPASN